MISITVTCRENRVKPNGKAPILIYLRQKGESRKQISTGIEVEPKYFDNKTKKFRKGSGDSVKLQHQLDRIMADVRSIVLDNPNASIEQIINAYKAEDSEGGFIGFARKELFVERKVLSYKAWKQYGYCLDLLERNWGEYIAFSELTAEGIRLFDYQMKVNGLGANTRKHGLKTLRKYVRRAHQQNLIKENPFNHYKVGNYQDAEREWVDEGEIEALKQLWEKRKEIPERLHGTLVHFLHSCHTGLRAVDSRRFKTSEHVKGDFITIIPSKSQGISQTLLRIPINAYCSYLNEVIDGYPLKTSHSKMGENLQEICELVGIDKHITFHCARHSFAINSLIKGVPLEVVSKWLGHTNISTTQIYGKIVDSLSGSEMEKWNAKPQITISLEDLGLTDRFKTKEDAINYLRSKLD